MSREERLFDAIGGVDESLLERSERAGRRRKVSRLEWVVGLAACLALVVVLHGVFQWQRDKIIAIDPGPDAPAQEDPLPSQQEPVDSAADQPQTLWPSEDGEMHYLGVRTAPEEPETRFRIYINRAVYYSYEQDGVYIIRPYQEPDGTPECKLEIAHMPDINVETAAEQVRASLTGLYAEIGDTTRSTLNGEDSSWPILSFRASDGVAWDSAQRDVQIERDGEGGVFVLSASYFLEAEEGHGSRFRDMMRTFLPEGVYGQSSVWLAELRDVGERLMDAVFAHDLDSVQDLLAPNAEVNTYVEDVSSWVTVASIDCSYVPGDPSEETLTGRVSVRHNASMMEDDYCYLTMELKKTGDQWTATWIGFES